MQDKSRRYESRIQKARRQRQLLWIGAGALVVCLALVFGIRALLNRPGADVVASGGAQATATPAPDASPAAEGSEGQEPDASPAPKASKAPKPAAKQPILTSKSEKVRMLPIIGTKKDEKKMIAITIDDCFDGEYVRKIVKLAEKHGAELTFFPKGNTIKKNAEVWKELYEKGYEIENHTYNHSNVTDMDDDKLRAAIVKANDALNEVLGVNYQMRIFRCPTGDGQNSKRLHKLLRELGYEAVASWGLSGTRKAAETIKLAKPGQIILFHATAKDYARLKDVIPALAKKYKLVSINTMYGKDKNPVTELVGTDNAGNDAEDDAGDDAGDDTGEDDA